MAGPSGKDVRARKETYEKMRLQDREYLCSVPIVEIPPRNDTSEAEARLEEKKELARATDRGWELLKDLEGNCLFFISGWWSYSFCYNSRVTQFHQLPPQPGKPHYPPQRDLTTPQYVLGKVKRHKQGGEEDWGNDIEVHTGRKPTVPAGMELQVRGDTRYLVQKLDSGTICDLTGKPRRIEVQFHCNPQVNDRIGYVKEVMTCEYLMLIYTPRLCNDVAFMPPKETKGHVIACRQIVPDDALPNLQAPTTAEMEVNLKVAVAKSPIVNVGGVIVGGHKYVGKTGESPQLPTNWAGGSHEPVADVIAHSKGRAEDNKVRALSDEELKQLDLDPDLVDKLRGQMQEMAGDHAWKLEVVDVPGEPREIRGILEGEDDEGDRDNNGSEEAYYKGEL